MSGLLDVAPAVVSALVGVGITLVSSAVAASYSRRRDDRAHRLAMTRLHLAAAQRDASQGQGDGDTDAHARALLSLVLSANELRILEATKQGVALDIAQICSAAQLSPSQVRSSIQALMTIGLLGGESADGDRSALRYRKQVADDVIGGGR